MNIQNQDSDEARLNDLLREARATPPLPPRFQENVWRRIEKAGAPSGVRWLDMLAGLLTRPRLAFAVATALVLLGIGLGWNNGEQAARDGAQARYLAAVAPNVSH